MIRIEKTDTAPARKATAKPKTTAALGAYSPGKAAAAKRKAVKAERSAKAVLEQIAEAKPAVAAAVHLGQAEPSSHEPVIATEATHRLLFTGPIEEVSDEPAPAVPALLTGEAFNEAEETAKPGIQPADYGLTPAAEAEILALGQAAGQAKAKVRKQRPRMTDKAWEMARAGKLPDPLIVPDSNHWMRRHADAIRQLASEGKVIDMTNYQIGGTNTYAKALRDYREALLCYIENMEAGK